MSHLHRHREIKTSEKKKPQRRHSSHDHHTHLTPASVIDHLKIKVKRKKLSKNDSNTLSDEALNQDININNNNNNKQSIEEHTESLQEILLTSSDYRPVLSSTKLPKSSSYDANDFEIEDENNVFIENNEHDAVVPNGSEDKEETIQWRTSPTTYDSNQKLSKSKQKSLKLTKSLSDTNGHTIIKKRRQTVRRTGFQIRDEDFSTIFRDLPSDEQLVIAYPCAWRKDVFMHGRMFLSVNYLCFYTCFFKWEESVCIPYKDIDSVTREKSVKVLRNAIKLRTKNQEQYVFCSTIPRERIFVAIFRLWQNALLQQPLDYQQLRALVFIDQQSHDETSGDSEESISLEHIGEDATESPLLSQSLPVTTDQSTLLSIRLLGNNNNNNRRIISLPPPDNETRTYLTSCTCETHLTKIYADRLFNLRVDTLYDYCFSDNSFTRNFHNAQKLTDYNYGEWHINKETGQKERLVTYKTIAQSVIGSNSLSCREKQILEVEKPNLIYVLSSEVYNEGMKYTDAFYVATKFCMIQKDNEHSSLKVTAEIRYVKNVNGLVKTFIEKNAYSSIEEGVNEQVRRLENQQVNKRKSTKKTVSISKNESIHNDLSHQHIEENSIPSSQSFINEKTITGKGIFYDIALLIGIFLLILHIYLCYKLYAIDRNLLLPETICLNQCQKTCMENKIYQ